MIAVFGANGMLGRYVTTHLTRQGHEVKEITRKDIDFSNFNDYYLVDYLINNCDSIINCAGTIKPVANVQEKSKTFMVNAIFPHLLARKCGERRMIHITTDCVYSGSEGGYDESRGPDVFDDYGFSKSIGDLITGNVMVLRTSIIGEELINKRSLLEWAKSQRGNEVNGFTNHYWNGVTCLQAAKVIEGFLTKVMPRRFHLHSDTVTKCGLLQLISDAFKLDLKIRPVEAPIACDRTLLSLYDQEWQGIIPPLKQQIEELVGFYDTKN